MRAVFDGQDDAEHLLLTRGDLAKFVSNAALFHEDPGPQLFEDIAPGSRYYDYVNRLTNRGVIGGYACGTVPEEPCVAPDNRPYYRPEVNALRGQVAKVVSNAAGFADEPSGQTFQDVPPGSTFYVWVERLAARGIAQGFECGSVPSQPCFAPDNRPYYRLFNAITKKDAQDMIKATFRNGGGE
jgi:hypothetical protein